MSIMTRRDNRSEKRFFADIKKFTRDEQKWAAVFQDELFLRGYKDVSYRDNGIDNSGKPLMYVDSRPDFIFTWSKNDKPLEIKTRYGSMDFFTYKVSSLKSCFSHDALILTVNKNWYMLFGKETIKYMLSHWEPKIYYGFSPNDPSIRIYKNEMLELVKTGKVIFREWKKELKNDIMKI
jgi:hypothetical protein